MKKDLKRRAFLKNAAALATLVGLPGAHTFANADGNELLEAAANTLPGSGKSIIGLKAPPVKQVKAAVIGLGNRGSEHARLLNAVGTDKVKITAICDIRENVANTNLDYLKKNGGQNPAVYSGKEEAWKEMLQRDDIDLVTIATPWEHHAPMALYAMQQGKHVAIEMPCAYTIEDCWKLVNTAEETRRNCMILENVCYGAEEMWLLNMVKSGVFGHLNYAECAYIHNLKELLFSKTYYYKMWRIRHNEARDGNLYPTHGLGPVAQYMDIDRGDRFDFLVSMSSKQANLDAHARTVESDNEFFNRTGFKHGDMNNTLIKTNMGRSILVQHDVTTDRPYNRINMLAGSKAFHKGYPSKMSVNGKKHGFLSDDDYQEYRQQYAHPLWAKLEKEAAKNGGHGGMDFIMLWRLVDCLNRGIALDMDVYDAASWSVVTSLSELSVQLGSVPVRFPDFTRGKWKERREPGVMANP
jgi:glycosyl hydrolase family 109/GFO/IDH/MocA oxidoreductase family protein